MTQLNFMCQERAQEHRAEHRRTETQVWECCQEGARSVKVALNQLNKGLEQRAETNNDV